MSRCPEILDDAPVSCTESGKTANVDYRCFPSLPEVEVRGVTQLLT